MNLLWNGKQMWLLQKCNQTAFEVLGRSVLANQEIPKPRKQMLVFCWWKYFFHRKLWGLIFTLVIITIFNMSREFISKMTFGVTAFIQSKQGFVIIAFDVGSVAFLSLLTSVAVNYPGRLPTQWRLLPLNSGISDARSYRHCWRLHWDLSQLRVCSQWNNMIFLSTVYAHSHGF